MIDPLFAQLTAALDQAAPHRQSVERLSHFQCGSCQGWWSIADAPDNRTWYCPWCGCYARPEPVEAARTADTPTTKENRPDG